MATEVMALKAKLIQCDGVMTPSMVQYAEEICKDEGISLYGLTILGGKAYINTTGLDQKVDALCILKNWVKAGCIVECLGDEWDKENDLYRCGFKATLTFFDSHEFRKAFKDLCAAGAVQQGVVEELRKQYTYSFADEGWAGTRSVKMSTMKNRDFLRMMASRRATNRAKRLATGCGLTSVEEVQESEVDLKPGSIVKENGRVIDIPGPPSPTAQPEDAGEPAPPPVAQIPSLDKATAQGSPAAPIIEWTERRETQGKQKYLVFYWSGETCDCWVPALYEYLEAGKGLEAELVWQKIGKTKRVVGIHRIGNRKFDADGMPEIALDEQRPGTTAELFR